MKMVAILSCLLSLSVSADPFVLGPFDSKESEFPQGLPVHGVAGDQEVLFVLQPVSVQGQTLGVHTLRRFTGQHLQDLTPPPGGFLAPLSAKVATSGILFVLDGFPPELAQTASATLYKYSYSYSEQTGLTSTLLGTLKVPRLTSFGPTGPNGLAYPGSIALLPGGQVAVIDMILGSIWVTDSSQTQINLAMIDPRFAAGPISEVDGVGRKQGGGTKTYRFETPTIPPFTGPSAPGIHAIAYAALTDEVLLQKTATPGGLFAVPLSVLLAPLPPPVKSAAVRSVVPPQAGLSDFAVGMDIDRFNPASPWVYWQRVICPEADGGCNVVRRVNLLNTKDIEVVAQSVTEFDWTNEISVLPSLKLPWVEITTLVFGNMQEENSASSNILLKGVSTYVGPTIVPQIVVFDFP